MSILDAQRLLRELETSKVFPPNREYKYRNDLLMYASFRESREDILQPDWWTTDPETRGRNWIIDPLPERIPEVWHEMLFGEPPEIQTKNKGDEKELEDFIGYNDLNDKLGWAEEINSSEGEVWWRYVVKPMDGRACLEWHSRLNVIPLWAGQRLAAVAFFSCWEDADVEYKEGQQQEEWVYLEIHSEGVILNRLYKHKYGTPLGLTKDLESNQETAGLKPQWNHSLPMLAGRIVNKLGRDWRCGISDYRGIRGLFFALNEIPNIGQGNLRLTGKQRAVIPERFLNVRGELPKGAEILIAAETDQDPDKIKSDFALIEWKFDAAALIAYKTDLVDTILTRARVAPPLIGRGIEGAQTGPSLRARLIDSQLSGQEKGKKWDSTGSGLPYILGLGFQLENLSVGLGGAGRGTWSSTDPPTVKRTDSIPDDPEAVSRRTVMEVNAKVLSKRTAVEENHPTWGQDRIDEEMSRLDKETQDALKNAQQSLMNPADKTSLSSGANNIPDPAHSLPRPPGGPKPTVVPDPNKPVRA